MPFDCQVRQRFGQDACLLDCPTRVPVGGFLFERIERETPVPPADARVIDIAVLDMHHGWPNLGHDAIVHALQTAVCDLRPALSAAGLSVRALSYDVRRGLRIPEPPGGRHELYLGTGGPGHLDPAMNDGRREGAQGIVEDASWEAPLFALFDRIRADGRAALFGVCHTFGVMCRWLGLAVPVLRGDVKGGKSTGIVENILTPEALAHPWFSRFAAELPDHRRFRVLDSRLYDLIPVGDWRSDDVAILAYETLRGGRVPGDAITMIEVSRDPAQVVPRILAANHHPEIVNRARQVTILRLKRRRGHVDPDWYAERLKALTEPIADEFGDRLLHLTSSYTLLAPVRYHVHRLVRERAARLGVSIDVDERTAALVYSLAHDPVPAAL
ncbi:MAG: hypothetical protein KJ066_17170 [Acidobacteria bacterium]|nr:hypothetical protein [Acidobacteriota bacterium]